MNNSGKFGHSETICWNCENAVPNKDGTRGCPWSREFKPVDGWDAKPEIRVCVGKHETTYTVRKCPMFIKENSLPTLNAKSRKVHNQKNKMTSK